MWYKLVGHAYKVHTMDGDECKKIQNRIHKKTSGFVPHGEEIRKSAYFLELPSLIELLGTTFALNNTTS